MSTTMYDTRDLHLEKELLPLLDFTHNEFSKKVLVRLLNEPLSDLHGIKLRQDTLKGFIQNNEVLRNFSYSRIDLYEVYRFMGGNSFPGLSNSQIRIRLMLSDENLMLKKAKFIQLALLLYKFNFNYFSRIKLSAFPESYGNELRAMHEYLKEFNTEKYELLIRENKFRITHIIELNTLLTKKYDTSETDLFWNRFFLFESLLSISFGMIRQKFTFPAIGSKIFTLRQFYHPSIENAVKNDLEADKNVVLLTGPNMSGKSTLLKAISLCIYLGHVGIGVPAEAAEFPLFECITVKINHSDNLLKGYSHFMNEIMNLKKVVEHAGEHKTCFAVFDELFIGTNIKDAVEISSTTVKGLTKFSNSIFFISTHLHQLKENETVKSGQVACWYIDCNLSAGIPVFTYSLKKGWSDIRLGRVLFENEGLNKLLSSDTCEET